MARTENDTWDLASSVGATATMVAAARALAANADEPVIDDPFAAPLVRAVGVDFFTKLVDDDFDLAALEPDAAEGLTRFANGMAARTRFFDDFVLDAARAGVRQFVILASGLDARAYRLPWPAGSVVFEIDQPEVIEFKTKALADLGALPTTDRRAVAVDLRFDWPAALTEAGFEASRPTAWIAEGLLGYLPPEAQDRLLDQIAELSAPGSRVAVEEIPAIEEEDHEEIAARMKDFSDRWRAHGFDLDFTELVFLGDRADVSSYLQGHGWKTTSMTSDELLVHNGLPRVDDDAQIGSVVYVTATR